MATINLTTFLDAAQRTIIGEQIDETDEILTIKNPVLVNIVPQIDPRTGQPGSQMALQLLPVYFKEFQGEKKNPVIFKYLKSQITQISFDGGFDFRLYGQYEHIFNSLSNPTPPTLFTPPQPASPPQETPVLKLFED